MQEEKEIQKISIATIIIGLAGFFNSLYALILHIQNLMQPGHGAFCDINTKITCSSVIGSQYGEFASIPLGSYGMAYFILILSAAIKISDITLKQLAKLEFFLGLVGFIFVLVLFSISFFILKKLCPTCSFIHIITVIYFALKIKNLFLTKQQSTPNSGDAYLRFLAVGLCLGIPPLAAGLIAPIIIDKFFPAASKKNQVHLDINKVRDVSQKEVQPNKENLIEKMMTFNKTNYVGNGEDYRRGLDSAKVVVQVFSDFGCPHCKDANAPMMQAQKDVGLDKVVLVYRFYPLTNKCNPTVSSDGWYPYSCILAEATRCAGSQGKFWEFKDWGFSGQEWTDEKRAQQFSLSGLKEKAKILGMNSDEFGQCIERNIELNKIKEDAELAKKLDIKGTPLILINGHEYTGAHSVESFTHAFQGY